VKFSKRNFFSKKFPYSILFFFLLLPKLHFPAFLFFHKNLNLQTFFFLWPIFIFVMLKTKTKPLDLKKKICNNFLKIFSEELFWNEKNFSQGFCLRNVCVIFLHNLQSPNELKIPHKLFRKTIKKGKNNFSSFTWNSKKHLKKIKTPQRVNLIFLLNSRFLDIAPVWFANDSFCPILYHSFNFAPNHNLRVFQFPTLQEASRLSLLIF